MTTVEFVAHLRDQNIHLSYEGGNLKCRAPRGALTPKLRDELADRKLEILSLLRATESQKKSAPSPLAPIPRDGELPLSFSQERLWFLHQVTPDSAAYNIVSSMRFERGVDIAALERSLNVLIERHETLRTTFASRDGQPFLRIAVAAPIALPVLDLRSFPDAERRQRIDSVKAREAEQPFDLAQGPLLRLTLIRASDHEAELLLSLHHVISDRWSLGVLMNELQVVYRALCDGVEPPLPALAVQYVDFAHWQRERLQGSALEDQLVYWRDQLAGSPAVLDLPTDRPRPAEQTHRGSWQSRVLPETLGTAVRAISVKAGVTPFMVFLAAFETLLHRYTGQDDILIGTPIAGRNNRLLEGLVGCFVNMLVLRQDVSRNPSFSELLARVRETALGAYSHADVPFEKLVADLHPQRDMSRSPFFQVAIAYQSSPKAVETPDDVSMTASGGTLFDLTLFVEDISGRFSVTAEYNVDLFEKPTIERMLGHFETLMAAALDAPDRPIGVLPMLTATEPSQLLPEWSGAVVDLQAGVRIHELVERQAAATPDAVAIRCKADSCTYGELNEKANQLAHHLRARGVGPDTLVGLSVERSVEMVVGLLGVLKAGGAYVPLDPSYPADRLEFMLEDAGVAILLTQERLIDAIPAGERALICLDRDWPQIAQESESNPPPLGSDLNLAYVIYTSGSTGRPKGVQIPHRAVVNFLGTMAHEPGLGPADVLVSVTTLSFDISGLEMYLPLMVGARVVVASREDVMDGRQLQALLESEHATVMQATPATWRLLLEAGWTGPRLKMLCGGEALPQELAAQLIERGGELWNLYGPTETTIWSTAERLVLAHVTIGRPIANTQTYVLDRHLQPVPVGVPGELYIAGDGLARGYRQRPDLTAERFVPNPFGPAGSRMYRTGDLARYLSDGRLECLGRVDHQVKVRGFRVELGEVEAALAAHPAIKETVVFAEEVTAGDKRLVAYVVYQPGESLTASELRKLVRATLPEYMVPSFFVKLDRIPLTPNGKVNRRALPGPFQGTGPERERVAPQTQTEVRIAEVWQRVLGVNDISVADNFFDIGGHSLLSMRVVADIERVLGARLNPRVMFLESLKQIAAQCDRLLASAETPGGGVSIDSRTAFGFSA
jgi:amino acid adenylation domain-containing protein